jgi:catechol 2,3-dioxygenase-like lactoylglutathione lyase family enzyme
MTLKIDALDIDTSDPERIATFWAEALGWPVVSRHDDEWVIEAPPGSPEHDVAPALLFGVVPEGKTVKNRLHLDLRPDDQAAEVARLTALGASTVDIGQGDVSWVVMADPDGNEFCVLKRRD